MPQTPTPNMGLVKPTENGDSGIWASLLDAMFDTLDAHDHSTGKGVQLKQSNTKIDADIPWSSGGTFYAISGLKAVDFQPQPAASMSGFFGALFVDSADNELSYRTTGGAVIKFTSGSTFAFGTIGAIGGDYVAAGALVDYVDANGLYRMRQENAGGAQQYALVQTGGVDLFEFKLHPTAGLPTQHVRLASPAALASSYTVTWPGALPATTNVLKMDNTGAITAPAGASLTYSHNVNLATLVGAASLAAGNVGAGSASRVALSTDTGIQVFPLVVPIGTLTAYSVSINKSSASGTISVKLCEGAAAAGTGTATQIGATQSNSANNPGNISLGQAGLSFAMTAGREYWIEVTGGGVTGDIITGYSASVTAVP